jgi:hypothetical protein
MTTTPGKPWLERGHHSWCALSDDNHRGPCEAVAENKVIHREPRPRLAQPEDTRTADPGGLRAADIEAAEPHDLQPGVPCRVPGCPGPDAARTADPGELRWRFVLWDGSAVEVALSDEDPADIGDPRTVTEDSTVYLTAVSGGVVSG